MIRGATPFEMRLRVFVFGPQFHWRRFLFSLICGLLAVTFVAATGISQALEDRLLDLRQKFMPMERTPKFPVFVIDLVESTAMTDSIFFSRYQQILQCMEGMPRHQPDLKPLTLLVTQRYTDDFHLPPRSTANPTHGAVQQAFGPRLAPETYDGTFSPEPADLSFPRSLNSIKQAIEQLVLVRLALPQSQDFPPVFGISNLPPETWLRKIVRSLPLLMKSGETTFPSLSLAAAMDVLGLEKKDLRASNSRTLTLVRNNVKYVDIPIDERGDMWLNYARNAPHTLPIRFQPTHMLSGSECSQLEDRIVQGSRGTSLSPTILMGDPRERVSTPIDDDIPAVYVHAQALVDILSGAPLRWVHPLLDIGISILAIVVLGFLVARFDPQGMEPLALVFAIGCFHGAFALAFFWLGSFWIDMALVNQAMGLTLLADAIFLHRYLHSAVQKLRSDMDQWRQHERAHLEQLEREEQEHMGRLEHLQHEEQLARLILTRQEAMVARVLPEQQVGNEIKRGAPLEDASMPGLTPNALVPDSANPAGDGSVPRSVYSDPMSEQQPRVLREFSTNYREQLTSYGVILSRYRLLLDRVLLEIQQSRSQRPAASIPLDGALADELVKRSGIVSQAPTMLRLIHQVITRIGPNDRTTVLIQGESGTGKELIARAIHRHSQRSVHPFLAVNCGAFPEGLIESELFGHIKGAFSGASRDRRGAFLAAHRGVLFLDEVGEAPASIQVKLLRVLQERAIRPVGADEDLTVDVRIVAATNRELKDDVRSGRFREDLFHRLNVIRVDVPPLRDRPGDIPLLCRLFLEREATAAAQKALTLSEGAFRLLCEHRWPGNVRELENYMVAICAMSVDPVVDESTVAKLLGISTSVSAKPPPPTTFTSIDIQWLKVFRRHRFSITHAVADTEAPAKNRQTGYRRLVGLVCKALYYSAWNPGAAAELLGGDGGGALTHAGLRKVHVYLGTIAQALKHGDSEKFAAQWRRFLGDDAFFIVAALDAMRVGRIDPTVVSPPAAASEPPSEDS